MTILFDATRTVKPAPRTFGTASSRPASVHRPPTPPPTKHGGPRNGPPGGRKPAVRPDGRRVGRTRHHEPGLCPSDRESRPRPRKAGGFPFPLHDSERRSPRDDDPNATAATLCPLALTIRASMLTSVRPKRARGFCALLLATRRRSADGAGCACGPTALSRPTRARCDTPIMARLGDAGPTRRAGRGPRPGPVGSDPRADPEGLRRRDGGDPHGRQPGLTADPSPTPERRNASGATERPATPTATGPDGRPDGTRRPARQRDAEAFRRASPCSPPEPGPPPPRVPPPSRRVRGVRQGRR